MNPTRIALLAIGVLIAPAASATTLEHVPLKVAPVTATHENEVVLEREFLTVDLRGSIASMVSTQTFRYDGYWFSPGTEAVRDLHTSHLAVISDYWITELGKRYPGVVRDRRSARAEYDKNLAQRKDPGIAEWITEGHYRFSIYPVPKAGGRKDQGVRILQVLPRTRDGTVRLRYRLPETRVERFELRLRVHGSSPGRVRANLPLAPDPTDPGLLHGTLEPCDRGTKELSVEIELDPITGIVHGPPVGESRLVNTPASTDPRLGDRLRHPVYLASSTDLDTLDLVSGDPPITPIPDDWYRRLAEVARIHHLHLDRDRPLDALRLARGAGVVAPEIVLMANPFATAEGVEEGWDQAEAKAAAAQAADRAGDGGGGDAGDGSGSERPGPVSPAGTAPDFSAFDEPGSPSGSGSIGLLDRIPEIRLPTLVPTFKSARERSYVRACYANQKTLAGAIEMWNLDVNADVLHCFVAGCSGITDQEFRWEEIRQPELYRLEPSRDPPPGVLVSSWRFGHRDRVTRVKAPVTSKACRLQHPGPVGAGPRVGPIPEAFLEALREQGYLQSIPRDPGFDNERGNYWMVNWDAGIFCRHHGVIQGYGKGPRDQLAAQGITDPAILRAANRVTAQSTGRSRNEGLEELAFLVLLMIGFGIVSMPFLAMKSREDIERHLRYGFWMILLATPAGLLLAIAAQSWVGGLVLLVAIVGVAVVTGNLGALGLKDLWRSISKKQ